MNDKPLFDATTDTALRELDPAPPHEAGELSTAEKAIASAALARIVASDPLSPGSRVARSVPRQHRRWLWVTATAAAAAIALVVGINLPGEQAFAGWTPVPDPLTRAQADAAMTQCTNDNADMIDPGSTNPRLLLAERRGGWTYVRYQPSSQTEASCLFPPDPDEPGGYKWGSFDSEPEAPFMGGSDDVEEWGYAVGTTKPQGLFSRGGLFIWTDGAVGSDVTALTITTPVGDKVIASIANGRYAAWWPAGENNFDNPQMNQGIGIEATLRDGTRKVIQTR